MVSGILNVDKPAGWTSFRLVAQIRRLSGVRRVGHAGTLDPSATGVLLICLGQAVRVSQYLMELPKTYRAEIWLGLATDTYDAAGRPIFVGDAASMKEDQVRKALATFVGEIQQVPPPYSALKRQGRPAYAHARAGRALALAPRRVLVYRLELLAFAPPLVSLEVECGKGTYIRSLAHDLGQRLGCGAHLRGLIRQRIGTFTLEEAHPWAEMQEALAGGHWAHLLLPLDYGLSHLPSVTLGPEEERDVRHGRPLAADAPSLARLEKALAGQLYRAYNQEGSFVGLLRFEAGRGLWRPEKVFQLG